MTTSLCSPSRASILTGQLAHKHGVLANRVPLEPELPTFGTALQAAGYDTAFIGKWHMGGENDSPRPGWNRWVSFPGQGTYVDQAFNIDGKRVAGDGYITDRLTDHAIEFLESAAQKKQPFLLYLSHKAVHSPFQPATRHAGSYKDRAYPFPESMADNDENYRGKPDWVRAQRMSWHGVDGMYNRTSDMGTFTRDYAEALRAVDDSTGRLLEALGRLGLDQRTVVVFTSDNGFQFGEHGLIDKRTAYEASIRVPLIVRVPGTEPTRRPEMVLNIDFAPTFIDMAGTVQPEAIDGRSFVPLLEAAPEGRPPWRSSFLYEYFWEWAFPQTPTTFALRTDTHKLIVTHGVWDGWELYDLARDPEERHNLIADYRTRAGIGNIDSRVLGPRLRVPVLLDLFGEGTDDEELRSLFNSMWTALQERIDDTGATLVPRFDQPQD